MDNSSTASAIDELSMMTNSVRSEEHTSELSHSQISYAVFCLKKKHLDGIKVHRAHIVELRPKIGDELFKVWRRELRRARRRRACPEPVEGTSAIHFLIALQLCAQSLFKCRFVGRERAKIDVVAA